MSLIILYWLIGGWAAACAGYDLAVRRIPNILTLGAHCAAVVILMVTGKSWLGASMLSCVSAWGLALLVTLPAYALKMLGSGDVKLLAAIGLMGGMQPLLVTYVIASLLMGGIAATYILIQCWRKKWVGKSGEKLSARKGRFLPFGFGFSVGFIIVLAFYYLKLSV